ncbi:MAG: PaaI family thioesterase [Gammaproteobacteria bacterium]|nr:PaaI family thioesterase [Gammaproteobacteria bacterium]
MESILEDLINDKQDDATLRLPPPVFLDMGGEFVDYVKGESLTARFPNRHQYENPFSYMQGGIIVALIDNTVSPLSYVVAPTSITREINTQFKRPITREDEFVTVKAWVEEITDSTISLKAEVRNSAGKLATRATVKAIILN